MPKSSQTESSTAKPNMDGERRLSRLRRAQRSPSLPRPRLERAEALDRQGVSLTRRTKCELGAIWTWSGG